MHISMIKETRDFLPSRLCCDLTDSMQIASIRQNLKMLSEGTGDEQSPAS